MAALEVIAIVELQQVSAVDRKQAEASVHLVEFIEGEAPDLMREVIRRDTRATVPNRPHKQVRAQSHRSGAHHWTPSRSAISTPDRAPSSWKP